jgi:hypothetical protein
MKVRELLPRAEAMEAIRANPRLAQAIEHVGRKTGIPEEVLRRHLG